MQGGHAEVVRVLLRAGAHVDRSTPYGYTPLALAARVSADASAELGWRQRHVAPDGLPTTPISRDQI